MKLHLGYNRCKRIRQTTDLYMTLFKFFTYCTFLSYFVSNDKTRQIIRTENVLYNALALFWIACAHALYGPEDRGENFQLPQRGKFTGVGTISCVSPTWMIIDKPRCKWKSTWQWNSQKPGKRWQYCSQCLHRVYRTCMLSQIRNFQAIFFLFT